MSQEIYEKGGENRLYVMQKLEMPPKNPPKSTQQTPPTFLKTHTSVDILEPLLVSWAEVLCGLPLFPPHALKLYMQKRFLMRQDAVESVV